MNVPPSIQMVYNQALSYHGHTLNNEKDIVETIYNNAHPTDVLADSSLWSPKRLDLVRQLLITIPIKILPAVRRELDDIEQQESSPIRELFSPDEKLHPRVRLDQYSAVQEHTFVMSRHMNLLNVRKRLLERDLKDHIAQTGEEAKGKARHKIVQRLLRKGVSWRTIRMANKGDPRRRYTDKALAVYGVLSPILTGRDCYILTADKDVFDQFYQFTVLLHDDYGSFLIARDFRQNPKNYPHVHPSSSQFMEKGAIAVGRDREPNYLLPHIQHICSTWVIDVNSFECMQWVGLREITSALDFQEQAGDGRVADGGNGRNVHISVEDPLCRLAPSHFTIGNDLTISLGSTPIGEMTVSYFDCFRVCADKPQASF